MKIFVTVGTTKFDTLIKYIDKNIKNENIQIIMQIADGYYKPINYKFLRFTSDIENLYLDSDVVITHAGAGSIYHLLALRKRIIIVPNIDRIDKHQTDIAYYMSRQYFAVTVNDFKEIELALETINSIDLKYFKKVDFFKAKEIAEYLLMVN